MNNKQINQIFELIRKSSETTRLNLRTLFLDRIGDEIIPFCIEHYSKESKAEIRNDLVRFLIQYAKNNESIIEFAKKTIKDKSKKVRSSAIAILAFSLKTNNISFLKNLKPVPKGNENDIKNAINAIINQNHNLFYPKYSKWQVSKNNLTKHLNRNEFKQDVDFYLSKKTVLELKEILGNIYD